MRGVRSVREERLPSKIDQVADDFGGSRWPAFDQESHTPPPYVPPPTADWHVPRLGGHDRPASRLNVPLNLLSGANHQAPITGSGAQFNVQ